MNGMWRWLVAGLILGLILIFANQSKTDASEKPQKQKAIDLQLEEIDDRYVKEFDEEDEPAKEDSTEECFAEPGNVVLLSPACASYDMFDNFQHRGEVFKEQVGRLKSCL